MHYYWITVFFLLGIILGSFYNVVGLRVPKKKPFANERSECPNCGHQLRWYELIPVLSFIIQQRKCRHCGNKIGYLYLFMELFTGGLFVFSYLKLGLSLELITVLLFISMLLIIFVSDLHYMLIPNKILLFFLPFLIIMRIIVPLDPWYDALLGGGIGFGLIALIIILSKGGMGAGDMKLFGVIGIVLGLGATLLTLFIASLLGAIIGGMMILFKQNERKQPIPFGPYIVIAAIISYFYGVKFFEWLWLFV